MITLEFHFCIPLKRVRIGKEIHLHRVVDHQVDRNHWIDRLGIASQAGDGGTHRSQVNHRRDPGKILHDHARRKEGDTGTIASRCPFGNILHVFLRDFLTVALAQSCLKQDTDGKRQFTQLDQAGFLKRLEPEDNIFLITNLESVARLK